MASALPRASSFESYRSQLSRGSRTPQDRRNRLDQYFQIKPQKPLVDVLQIQLHPLLERNSASSADLPQTGDTGTDAEAPALPILVETLIIADGQRPWPD